MRTIKNPLGWMAGINDPVWQVLMNVSIEMLAHRSDLLEEEKLFLSARTQMDLIKAHEIHLAAEMLEKYSTAITIMVIQLMTPDQLGNSRLDGLTELAAKHELFMPEEFKVKKDGKG